jgi:hypothetical protein
VVGETYRRVNPWTITFSVMLATFMEILDTTVVNVSVPHIAGNLASTIEEGTWVVTSYLVSSAIVLPMSGWLANYVGRKAATHVCCWVHPDLVMLRVGNQSLRVDLLPGTSGTHGGRIATPGTGHSSRNIS